MYPASRQNVLICSLDSPQSTVGHMSQCPGGVWDAVLPVKRDVVQFGLILLTRSTAWWLFAALMRSGTGPRSFWPWCLRRIGWFQQRFQQLCSMFTSRVLVLQHKPIKHTSKTCEASRGPWFPLMALSGRREFSAWRLLQRQLHIYGVSCVSVRDGWFSAGDNVEEY